MLAPNFFITLKVFEFADKHRGSYNDAIGHVVCPYYYCDGSGFLVCSKFILATNFFIEYFLSYLIWNI